MTPADTDTARSLSLAVHEHVMGRRVLSEEEMRAAWPGLTATRPGHPIALDAERFRITPHQILGGEPTFIQLVPDYSGSIEAAWKVVERMRALGYWCQIQYCRTDCDVEFTKCDTDAPAGTDTQLVAHLPEAICRAALAVCAPDTAKVT